MGRGRRGEKEEVVVLAITKLIWLVTVTKYSEASLVTLTDSGRLSIGHSLSGTNLIRDFGHCW